MSGALYFNKGRPELRMPSVDPGVPDVNGITSYGPVGTGRLSAQEALLQQAAEIAKRGAVFAGGPGSCIRPEPKPIFVSGFGAFVPVQKTYGAPLAGLKVTGPTPARNRKITLPPPPERSTNPRSPGLPRSLQAPLPLKNANFPNEPRNLLKTNDSGEKNPSKKSRKRAFWTPKPGIRGAKRQFWDQLQVPDRGRHTTAAFPMIWRPSGRLSAARERETQAGQSHGTSPDQRIRAILR